MHILMVIKKIAHIVEEIENVAGTFFSFRIFRVSSLQDHSMLGKP